MHIMNTSDITKITLYTNECYGCDRANKYGALRLFIIKNELPLNILMVKRVELNKKWMAEINALNLPMPAITIEFNDGESEYMESMTYNEFLERLEYKLDVKKTVAKRRRLSHPAADGAMSNDGNDQNNESSAPTTSDSIERLKEPDAAPEVENE